MQEQDAGFASLLCLTRARQELLQRCTGATAERWSLARRPCSPWLQTGPHTALEHVHCTLRAGCFTRCAATTCQLMQALRPTLLQLERRNARSVRRIARWVTGLLGPLDLTPSDSALALVLVAALQRKRRRCLPAHQQHRQQPARPPAVQQDCTSAS